MRFCKNFKDSRIAKVIIPRVITYKDNQQKQSQVNFLFNKTRFQKNFINFFLSYLQRES